MPPIDPKPLDPSWLSWIPADRTVAAFAVALDPRPEAWDALFDALDRAEKADPALAHVAPIRDRLNLLARAAGIRPDIDLWPHLLGLTAFATANEARTVDGALIALHLDAEPAAVRLLPRLVRVAGKSSRLDRRGSTLLIARGDAILDAALDAREHPERSASQTLRASWPAQLPNPPEPSGLADSSTTWKGPSLFLAAAEGARDEVRWTELRAVVRRFLEKTLNEGDPSR